MWATLAPTNSSSGTGRSATASGITSRGQHESPSWGRLLRGGLIATVATDRLKQSLELQRGFLLRAAIEPRRNRLQAPMSGVANGEDLPKALQFRAPNSRVGTLAARPMAGTPVAMRGAASVRKERVAPKTVRARGERKQLSANGRAKGICE
jgi:hypothetical protein